MKEVILSQEMGRRYPHLDVPRRLDDPGLARISCSLKRTMKYYPKSFDFTNAVDDGDRQIVEQVQKGNAWCINGVMKIEDSYLKDYGTAIEFVQPVVDNCAQCLVLHCYQTVELPQGQEESS